MGHLNLKLRGVNLESPSALRAFTAPSPVYKLSAFQMGQANPFQVVMSSEIVAGNEKPVWKAASIDLEELCSNDKDFPIMISVFDYAEQELLIGTCETTVSGLIRNRVGNADDVDVAKVFALKDSSRQRNETGLIVVVEAFITDEPLVGDHTMGASFARRDQQLSDRNETNAELESLRKALDAMLLRTEKLEAETSDLRHENKRLNTKVGLLEETLMQTRTKMKTAIKDMNLMNDGHGSFRSDNSKSIRLTDYFLDESDNHANDDDARSHQTKESHRSVNSRVTKDKSPSHQERHGTERISKEANHHGDGRSAHSRHTKGESRHTRWEEPISRDAPPDRSGDGRSTHRQHTKGESRHTRWEEPISRDASPDRSGGRSTHRQYTKGESHHNHWDQPISRDTSPDRTVSRSVSPRGEDSNRARKERSKHRDRTVSPKRNEGRSAHRERSKTPDRD